MEENNLKKTRLEKLGKIKSLGWNPYAPYYSKTHTVSQVLDSMGKNVKTAGRLSSYREHGNIAFADLKDETGKVQLFFRKTTLGEDNFKNLKLLDIGDFIGVEGKVVKTRKQFITILISLAGFPNSAFVFGVHPDVKSPSRSTGQVYTVLS